MQFRAHWNHSFHLHLSCLEPASCSFPSCVAQLEWLHWLRIWQRAAPLSPSWVPQGSPSGVAVVAWWLKHPLFTVMAGNFFHPQDHLTQWESSGSGSMYILGVVLAASIPLIPVLFAESSDPNRETDLWFPGWAFHQGVTCSEHLGKPHSPCGKTVANYVLLTCNPSVTSLEIQIVWA